MRSAPGPRGRCRTRGAFALVDFATRAGSSSEGTSNMSPPLVGVASSLAGTLGTAADVEAVAEMFAGGDDGWGVIRLLLCCGALCVFAFTAERLGGSLLVPSPLSWSLVCTCRRRAASLSIAVNPTGSCSTWAFCVSFDNAFAEPLPPHFLSDNLSPITFSAVLLLLTLVIAAALGKLPFRATFLSHGANCATSSLGSSSSRLLISCLGGTGMLLKISVVSSSSEGTS